MKKIYISLISSLITVFALNTYAENQTPCSHSVNSGAKPYNFTIKNDSDSIHGGGAVDFDVSVTCTDGTATSVDSGFGTLDADITLKDAQNIERIYIKPKMAGADNISKVYDQDYLSEHKNKTCKIHHTWHGGGVHVSGHGWVPTNISADAIKHSALCAY